MPDTDLDSPPDPAGTASPEIPSEPDVDHLLDRLERLEELVDHPDERKQVRETMAVVRRIPGLDAVGRGIRKYTARDMAEAFVGTILLALPMLVEDGVFVIAEHFVGTTRAGVPIYLVGNVVFVVVLTIGLLYWTDIREVNVTNPIFGVIPRRLVGVLTISFVTAAALLAMWGRLEIGDPTSLEAFARITVVWSAGAIGAALGDILPGESAGHDVTIENLDEIVSPNE